MKIEPLIYEALNLKKIIFIRLCSRRLKSNLLFINLGFPFALWSSLTGFGLTKINKEFKKNQGMAR